MNAVIFIAKWTACIYFGFGFMIGIVGLVESFRDAEFRHNELRRSSILSIIIGVVTTEFLMAVAWPYAIKKYNAKEA